MTEQFMTFMILATASTILFTTKHPRSRQLTLVGRAVTTALATVSIFLQQLDPFSEGKRLQWYTLM